MNARKALFICLQRGHLWRTGTISIVVGTWLTLFNHVDLLLIGGFDRWLLVKIMLNFLTPFVVSNLGVLSREED